MTARKRSIGSDLAKVDAYENTPADYEELPDMADRDPADGIFQRAGVPVLGRRPLGDRRKRLISLRLDPDVIDHFRATGAGWQGRMNGFLAARREIVELIEGYEASALEMRKLIALMRKEGSGLKPVVTKSMDSTERQFSMTAEAARKLREMLNDQAAAHAIKAI